MVIGRPPVNGWLGRKAFNKFKGRKFADLVELLDDNQFRSFCSAIGYVEVTWAMMENNLDYWIQIIYKKLNGSSLNSRVPTAFGQKVKFLRKAFTGIGQLAAFRDEALDILERASKLSQMRNDLTHSVITSMKSVGGIYHMSNFRLDGNADHNIRHLEFNVRNFPEISLELTRLGSLSLRVSDRLMSEFYESDESSPHARGI
jgi:hypothetical protein